MTIGTSTAANSEANWATAFSDAIKRHRGVIAASILTFAYILNLIPAVQYDHISATTKIDYTLIARATALFVLGTIILNLLVEIYKKVTESANPEIFENFHDASATVWQEIDNAAKLSNEVNIRILGLAGYHWQYIENGFIRLLENHKAAKVDLKFLMIDPEWDGIETCNPSWKSHVLAATASIEEFNANPAFDKSKSHITVGYYRTMPQLWGILINDSVLFSCSTSWENNHLRIDRNPMSLIKLSDKRFAKERIAAFGGWFNTLWSNCTSPTQGSAALAS